MQRIHIVGSSPRSGTSLLTEMMINSFEIDIYPEHEARLGMCPPRNGRVFLSKSPKDIVIVEKRLKLMKNLHIIYVMRDPRDSAVSVHGNYKDEYYGDLRYWHNYMPYYEKVKDHPRLLHIKYEDLVTDPDHIQSEISSRMPFLIFKDKFSNFHTHSRPSYNTTQALKGLRKVDSAGIGNWKIHKARILGQIKLHGSISKDLIRFEYEENDEWIKELEGVVPDLKESHFSLFRTEKFIRRKQHFKYLKSVKLWFCHTPAFLNTREIFRSLSGHPEQSPEG